MSDSTIIAKKCNFSQISNVPLRDNRLSLKAKGLYSLIQCFCQIPNFVLRKNYLETLSTDGKTSFNSAWKELKDNGYLIAHKQNVQGRYVYTYELLEKPQI